MLISTCAQKGGYFLLYSVNIILSSWIFSVMFTISGKFIKMEERMGKTKAYTLVYVEQGRNL